MKRFFGFLAFWLGCIGLLACVAAVIAIWVIRPGLTHASRETIDTIRSTLTVVDEKTKLANQALTTVREIVDPVTLKIKELADKAQSPDPEDQKEMKRLEEELAKRLQQIDSLAEVFQTGINVLKKSARVAKLLPFGDLNFDRIETPVAEGQSTVDSLAKLSKILRMVRETLAQFREEKQFKREIADKVFETAREVNTLLVDGQNKINKVQQRVSELDEETAELRTELPRWITTAAIIGTVALVWIGLGQLALLRTGLALRKEGD